MATRTAKSKTGWWARCVRAVNRGARGVYDPEAVCGALLRDKRRAGIPEGGRGRKASTRGRGAQARRGRSMSKRTARGQNCGCQH